MNDKWVVVNTRTEQIASSTDSELYDDKLKARSDARHWNKEVKGGERRYRVYKLTED